MSMEIQDPRLIEAYNLIRELQAKPTYEDGFKDGMFEAFKLVYGEAKAKELMEERKKQLGELHKETQEVFANSQWQGGIGKL